MQLLLRGEQPTGDHDVLQLLTSSVGFTFTVADIGKYFVNDVAHGPLVLEHIVKWRWVNIVVEAVANESSVPR